MKKRVGVWSEKERNDDSPSHVYQLFLSVIRLFYITPLRKVDTFIIYQTRAKFKEQDPEQIEETGIVLHYISRYENKRKLLPVFFFYLWVLEDSF